MTGRSHLLFGIGTGVVAVMSTPALSVLHLPLIGVASLLPDVDSPTSMLGKKVKLLGKIFTHRGFLHTPLFLALFFLITNPGIRWSCVIGIASHLFLDMFNRGGIMLLYPFGNKKFRLASLKCGAWAESGIVLALIAIEVVMLKVVGIQFPHEGIMSLVQQIIASV